MIIHIKLHSRESAVLIPHLSDSQFNTLSIIHRHLPAKDG